MRVAEVWPEIGEEPLNHWRVGVGTPVTVAVKVTESPTVAVWVTGWVVKAGATGARLTDREAAEEETPEGELELVATSL